MSSMSAVTNALREIPQTSLEVGGSAEKLFATFDEAVAAGDLELADSALRLIEVSLMLREDDSHSKEIAVSELVRCHSQLWLLRHPQSRAAA